MTTHPEGPATAGHTAGPWRAKEDKRRTYPWTVEAPGVALIAEVVRQALHQGPDAEAEANARLIAASPETAAERDALRIERDDLAARYARLEADNKRLTRRVARISRL